MGLFHPFQTRFSGHAKMGGHAAGWSDLQSLHTAQSSSQGGLAAVTMVLHRVRATAALDAPLLIHFVSSSNKMKGEKEREGRKEAGKREGKQNFFLLLLKSITKVVKMGNILHGDAYCGSPCSLLEGGW